MMTSTNQSLPRDKSELIERIRRSHAELETVVETLTEVQLTTPGPGSGWTIKDHLAHVAAWEQIVLGGLRGRPEHDVYGIDETEVSSLTTDRLNALLTSRSKLLPADEVLDSCARTHRELLEHLAGMNDEELSMKFAPDDDRTRMQKLAGDTFLHYPEHRDAIERLADDSIAGDSLTPPRPAQS